MTQLSLAILAESPQDGPAVERLHDHVFGPGRYTRSAFRLREGVAFLAETSFIARVGTLLVGAVRLSPIRIGDTPALVKRSLDASCAHGHRLVLLVGDEPYYGRMGFKRVPDGRVVMPGPVDRNRVLVAELVEGAFAGVSGPARAAL